MKQILLMLSYWSYIQLSSPFPIEEQPGFTPWPLDERDVILRALNELEYSGVRGAQLGVSGRSHFGIPDPTCRGKLPGVPEGRCWPMDHITVDVSNQEPKPDQRY
jgi:hypothetical protein